MGRRQRRISNAAISGHRNELTGKSANIVLLNGQVFFAEILTIGQDAILTRNFRSKKVSIPFNTISEIILDY